MAEASDEEGEAAPGAVVRRPPPPDADAPLPPDQEARRRAVLARLAQEDEAEVAGSSGSQGGQEQGGGGEAAPAAAAAAGKALSSLWGWGATLASRVEAAAVNVGREIAGTVQEAQPAVQAASRCAPQGRLLPPPCAVLPASSCRRCLQLSCHRCRLNPPPLLPRLYSTASHPHAPSTLLQQGARGRAGG